MRNLWLAFIRMLPKRVLLEDGIYYPQVWFIWWHYVRDSDLCVRWLYTLEEAKYFLEHKWDPVKVVWKNGKAELDDWKE